MKGGVVVTANDIQHGLSYVSGQTENDLCHWGQLKLLMGEIELLSLVTRDAMQRGIPNSQILVLYVGSAPCDHFPVNLNLFYGMNWMLYDPREFSVGVNMAENASKRIRECNIGENGDGHGDAYHPGEIEVIIDYFTDRSISHVKETYERLGCQMLVYINDMRRSAEEILIAEDMVDQQLWGIELQADYMYLKFRLPYVLTKDPDTENIARMKYNERLNVLSNRYEDIVNISGSAHESTDLYDTNNKRIPISADRVVPYLDGIIYLQCFARSRSTEMRLFVTKNVSGGKLYNISYYNYHLLDSKYNHFNSIIRPALVRDVDDYTNDDDFQLYENISCILPGVFNTYDIMKAFLILRYYNEVCILPYGVLLYVDNPQSPTCITLNDNTDLFLYLINETLHEKSNGMFKNTFFHCSSFTSFRNAMATADRLQESINKWLRCNEEYSDFVNGYLNKWPKIKRSIDTIYAVAENGTGPTTRNTRPSRQVFYVDSRNTVRIVLNLFTVHGTWIGAHKDSIVGNYYTIDYNMQTIDSRESTPREEHYGGLAINPTVYVTLMNRYIVARFQDFLKDLRTKQIICPILCNCDISFGVAFDLANKYVTACYNGSQNSHEFTADVRRKINECANYYIGEYTYETMVNNLKTAHGKDFYDEIDKYLRDRANSQDNKIRNTIVKSTDILSGISARIGGRLLVQPNLFTSINKLVNALKANAGGKLACHDIDGSMTVAASLLGNKDRLRVVVYHPPEMHKHVQFYKNVVKPKFFTNIDLVEIVNEIPTNRIVVKADGFTTLGV